MPKVTVGRENTGGGARSTYDDEARGRRRDLLKPTR